MAKRPPLAAVGSALLVALLASLLSMGFAPHAGADGACDTGSAALDSDEMEMVRLHNEMRAQNGLGPLVLSPGLSRMAAWKSADTSASGPTFNHTDSLGRGPSQRSRDCGYPADAAENIAYGYSSAAATFDAWMASPGHKTNILMSYYVMIGIGRTGDRWVVNFGLYNDSAGSASLQAAASPTAVPPTATPRPVIPTPTPAPPPPPPPGEWLEAGATLVTYEGPTLPISEAVAPLGSNLRFVYAFDAATGKWQRYAPGRPRYVNSLTTLRQGQQYFVGVGSGTQWTW